MNKLGGLLLFTLGAAVGAAASMNYFKKKYEAIAQEEIYAVREFYTKKKMENDAEDMKDEEHEESEEFEEENEIDEERETRNKEFYNYAATIKDLRYTNEERKKAGPKPYVISPDEFGMSDEDYTCISLSYYEDQVLADDADHIVEDVENVVGFESLTHFGEYEDDCVYVRNDRRKCDYEILLRQEKYTDVLKRKPYLREGKE